MRIDDIAMIASADCFSCNVGLDICFVIPMSNELLHKFLIIGNVNIYEYSYNVNIMI
jgi:hypothetical protein